MYFRIKKRKNNDLHTFRNESTKSHTQALYSGQSLLNTVLQPTLKKWLGFSAKQHSFSIFFGALGLKKNKIDSTEIITKKSPKKVTIFLWEPENSKKLNIFSDCSEFVNLNI